MAILVYRFRGLRENDVCSGGYADLIRCEESAHALYFRVIAKRFSITKYIEQNSSSQTSSTVAWQENPRILRKIKLLYHIYNNMPVVHLLIQINNVHGFP